MLDEFGIFLNGVPSIPLFGIFKIFEGWEKSFSFKKIGVDLALKAGGLVGVAVPELYPEDGHPVNPGERFPGV